MKRAFKQLDLFESNHFDNLIKRLNGHGLNKRGVNLI